MNKNILNYYFFSLDLDGTLLNNKSKIDEKTWKFLHSFNNWMICTGRSYEQVPEFIKKEFKDKIFICMNGAQIIYKNKEHRKYLSPQAIKEIIKKANKTVDFQNNQPIDVNKKYSKVSVFDTDISLTHSSKNWFEDHWEIQPKGISKGWAINHVKKLFKINQEIIHIGDSLNDMSVVENNIRLLTPRNADKRLKVKSYFKSIHSNNKGVFAIINNFINFEMKIYRRAEKEIKTAVPPIRQQLLKSMLKDYRYLSRSELVDKIEVRSTFIKDYFDFPEILYYIEKDNIDEILSELKPDQKYVLKGSFGSGAFMIKKGSELSKAKIKRFMRKYSWKFRYGKREGEPQYRSKVKQYYIEKYLGDELNEIKLHVFKDKIIPTVVPNRFEKDARYAWYDESLTKRIEYLHGEYPIIPYSEKIIPYKELKEVINIAKKMRKYMPFYFRLDVPYANGKLYFGEVTFHHNGGRIKFNGNDKLVKHFSEEYEKTNGKSTN